jgi:uncharacterized protein (DUF736 family)
MSTRIGALWRGKDKETGAEYISGTLECDTGLNIPAGYRQVKVKVVPNAKKTEGDKLPDFYLEAYIPSERAAF